MLSIAPKVIHSDITLAPSDQMADAPVRTSPSGSWSRGSTCTLEQVSSCQKYCSKISNFIVSQRRKAFPRTRKGMFNRQTFTTWAGSWKINGDQPYRRAKASLKALLCRAKPCSWRGRAQSQLDAIQLYSIGLLLRELRPQGLKFTVTRLHSLMLNLQVSQPPKQQSLEQSSFQKHQTYS